MVRKFLDSAIKSPEDIDSRSLEEIGIDNMKEICIRRLEELGENPLSDVLKVECFFLLNVTWKTWNDQKMTTSTFHRCLMTEELVDPF